MSRDRPPSEAELSELSELTDLVRDATALAPLIAPPAWQAAGSPRPGLSFDAPSPPDRAAWIQLGATIEAIDVAGSETGLAFSVDPYTREAPLPVMATSTTMSITAHRLAACLRTPAGSFRDAPLRLAAHVSARLASAAALRDCALVWIESTGLLSDLAAALPPSALPPGASGLAVITAPRDDRGALVRGGRAACRVWLEAISLGLAVQPVPALEASMLAAQDVRLDGVLVAALAVGAAA